MADANLPSMAMEDIQAEATPYDRPGASVRVVLGTHVVVSGLIWRNAPRQSLDAAYDRRITLYTSSSLSLAELTEVLDRVDFAEADGKSHVSPEFLTCRYALLARDVGPAEIRSEPSEGASDFLSRS